MDRFDVQNAGEITLSMLMPFVLVHAWGRASTFLHHTAGHVLAAALLAGVLYHALGLLAHALSRS
jgi:hypothetical protein